ncbi:MAG: JAB domain-containing protein [Bacteroidota bacterium]
MNVKLSATEKIKILNSDDVFTVMRGILLREDKIDKNREHFWVVGLATSNRILFIELISMGSVNATVVEPMEVFSFALQKRAVKIIMVHNHPGGELAPSDKDLDITDRMIQVGKIVNTPVLDHLIISTKTYMSFTNSGIMSQLELSTKYVPPFELVERVKADAQKLNDMYRRSEQRFIENEKKLKEKLKDKAKAVKEEKAKAKAEKAKAVKEERAKADAKVKQAKIEMAKGMMKKGLSLKNIAELTGLSLAEIRKL